MQKLSTAIAFLTSSLAVSIGNAWAQSPLTDASKHPSGSDLIEGVETWVTTHTGAATALGVSLVVAIGLLVYNRYVAPKA